MEYFAPALGVLSSLAGGISNYYSQKEANKANIKLWEKQAEYNTPKNQMKRLAEAGLNPYLYTTGVSGGEMSNSPTINANTGIGDALTQVGSMANNYGARVMEYKIRKQAELRQNQEFQFNRNVIEKTKLDNDLLKIEKLKRMWELNSLKQSYYKTNRDIALNELSSALNINRYKLQENMYYLDKDKFNFSKKLNTGNFLSRLIWLFK